MASDYDVVFPIGSGVMSSNSDFGAFVRQRRKASGLTQRALGELAGVGTRFVSELERGKTSVRLDVVNRVLATFGKTVGIVDARKGVIE